MGLRDYGVEGQIGLEATPEEYVEVMLSVFREVWRVLRPDGTLWLNLGDCYTSGGRGSNRQHRQMMGDATAQAQALGRKVVPRGLKPKELCLLPARVSLALQADGWYVRSDIIWHKPNPMPESVNDRPTKAHEYLFLLSKNERYHYDQEAIKDPVTGNAHSRGDGVNPKKKSCVLDDRGRQTQSADRQGKATPQTESFLLGSCERNPRERSQEQAFRLDHRHSDLL